MDCESRLPVSYIRQYITFRECLESKINMNNVFLQKLLTIILNLQPNKWFLMPYLISAFIFAYTLAYKTLKLWLSMDLHTYKDYSLINLTLCTFAGLYCVGFKLFIQYIFMNLFLYIFQDFRYILSQRYAKLFKDSELESLNTKI